MENEMLQLKFACVAFTFADCTVAPSEIVSFV